MVSTVAFLSKLCSKCKTKKTFDNFQKSKSHKGGVHSICKKCKSIIKKKHYKENKASINKYNNSWYENNKKSKYLKGKEWENSNKEASLSIKRKYERNRKLNDPMFKLRKKLRSTCRRIKIKGVGRKTEEILGANFDTVLKYLGSQPSEEHIIDHTCPLAQAQNLEELTKLGHYTNLRWLTRLENTNKLHYRTPEAEHMCKKLLRRDWI